MANTAASRQVSCQPSPRTAEIPRIKMPASENRAVSRISGGQSVTPILPATKAKLQSRLNRTAKDVTPTEAGERLLSYARRLLSLAEEARDVVTRPGNEGAVRLGIPEDFAAYRLAKLLAAFSRSHPALRLDVRADQSVYLKRELERGELDLALFKRAAGEKGGIAVWPERVHWVTSKSQPRDTRQGSVPLIGFPTGCLYRAGAIHALESAGRTWHMAYTSSNLSGIQAAIAAGMGLSILSE